MKRRTVVMGAVAAAAAAAGAGVATLRRPHRSEPAIWSMRFDAPDGPPLVLAALRGKPLLLNFWATWCPPCVEELPMLDRFDQAQRARGWQVVGLAVDNRDPVRAFLAKRPVGFPIGLAGSGGVELSHALGNTGGGLPFSVLFDRQGGVVDRKLGILAAADLQRWVDRIG